MNVALNTGPDDTPGSTPAAQPQIIGSTPAQYRVVNDAYVIATLTSDDALALLESKLPGNDTLARLAIAPPEAWRDETEWDSLAQ